MAQNFNARSLGEIMTEHIACRGNSDTVNLLWSGYLAALAVEGHLTDQQYHELKAMLKDVGGEELRELFIGYPGQFE